MKRSKLGIALVMVVAALPLAACGGSTAAGDDAIAPAVLEQVEGSDIVRITLTQEAAGRLDIQTAQVQDASGSGQQTAIPYAAVLYEPEGATFTYTSPEPLVFVRQPITVDRIEGDLAFLAEGPPAGTAVVTVGAAELFGTELGIDQ